MSVVSDIRDAAIDEAVSITTLLRRVQVLAAKLGNEQLKEWVRSELNGYASESELPGYRILPARARGNLAGPFNSGYKGLIIPESVLPEGLRKFASSVMLRQPISAIQALADQSNESGTFTFPWPGDLTAMMQEKISPGNVLWAAWQEVSRSQLVGLIDTIRNRVLDFALELEQQSPEAGDDTSPTTQAESKAVAQYLVQTFIFGNVGNVANASNNASQIGTIAVKGNFVALTSALKQLGVPDGEISDLKSALDDDGGTLGSRTTGWVAKIGSAISTGAIKVGSEVSTDALVKLISLYIGI